MKFYLMQDEPLCSTLDCLNHSPLIVAFTRQLLSKYHNNQMCVGLTVRRACGKQSADTSMFDSQKAMCKPIDRIYLHFALMNGTANTDCISYCLSIVPDKVNAEELWSPAPFMYRTESSFPLLVPHKIADLTSLSSFCLLVLPISPAQPMLF